MASPFTLFRRHQKVMLAVVGIMAMVSFVFLPIIADSVRSLSRGGTNPVVVASRFGDLQEADLYQLRRQRSIVANFLTRAMAEVGPEQANPQWYAYQKQMASMYLGGRQPQEIDGLIQRAWLNQVQSSVEREVGPATEQALAENWLLGKRARQLGIVISDQAVINFLRDRVAGLQADKARQIIDGIGVGQQQLLEAFRNQLLAARLRQMFQLSLYGSTPAERWADYQKLHRQATVEVAALPVANFVAKVADPDEKTLNEYFERYKDRPYDPNSPEPGFREPYRTTVEYFKAEYEKFVDPKSVTDEEIAKYYEEHKSEYVKRELPKAEEPAKTEPKPATSKPEGSPAKVPAKAAAPEPLKEKPAVKAAEKAAEKPAAEKPAPEKPKDKPQTKGKSSSLWKSARVSLAAFEKETEKDKAASPAKKTEAKPAETKPAEAKPSAVKPAEPKPAAQAKSVEPKPVKPAAEAKPAEPKPQTLAAKPQPVQYVPLAQVRDQIRDRLAREHAAKKMQSVLEPIRDQLRRHSAQLARAKGKNEEPPKFDAAGVAKANGLVTKHLEMVSQRDVGGADIAGSRTSDQQTFEQHVFRTPGLGRPTVSQDLEGNKYLFWKADENKEHVPKLDDPGVRARVVAAWKMSQALELAKAEANRLAEKARQSKAPLKEALKQEPGAKVQEPKPFSWLTRGQVPLEMNDQGPPQYSRVEGLGATGHAFMQTVFSMEPGGVSVATNMPKTEVFVIRADQFSPSAAVLWELFIHEDYGRYASAAYYEQMALYRSWLDEIKDGAAFQWNRPPDQREEGTEPPAPQEPIEPPQF